MKTALALTEQGFSQHASTVWLRRGWNAVDGMLVEERDACVAGAVCDQTDDQHQEQVPGPLRLCIGSLTRYPGFCLPNKISSRICRNVSFQIPVIEIHQTRVKGRIGCLALAEGIWLYTCSALLLISHCTVHTNAAPFEWEFSKEIVKKMQVS